MNRNFFILVLGLGILVLGLALIILTMTMQKPSYQPGELPDKFIHQHEVSDFNREVFENRRENIIGETDADIIIISTGAGVDFRYVTGFDERRGTAVIVPGADDPYTLFVTPWEVYTVMWTGEVYGTEGAIEKFGADAAYAIGDFDEMLPELLRGKERIFLHGNDSRIRNEVDRILESMGQRADIHDLQPVLHEHRVIKDEWEIAQLRQAVDVTVKAHQYVLRTVEPGQAEYEVQAEIEYIYGRNGLKPGFSSIVGSGPNSCLLHHTRNNRTMKDGDLLLMDIGAASRGGYSADVTRTIPVNGTFSPEQREIYKLVLKASDEAMEKIQPGHRMLDCNHKAMEIMVEGLHQMGLIPDTTSWWQKRFYIQHRVNHYIGLQTHDAGDYGFDTNKRDEHILTPEIRGREIKPGMVMTLEPGLYFMENLLDGIHEMFGHLATEEELNAFVEEVRPIYEKYEGIGVRIEDDILVTENGYENLSAGAPRTIRDIEEAMKR